MAIVTAIVFFWSFMPNPATCYIIDLEIRFRPPTPQVFFTHISITMPVVSALNLKTIIQVPHVGRPSSPNGFF
jgi:hypothetical protein